ncbi:MAG: MOSC N-terminal beta barrel domain-containing protein [Rhodospirillaceae bacterium]
MNITVAALYRYPVKGLSPEALDSVALEAGAGVPGDRRFAIMHGSRGFDALRPSWLPGSAFITLNTHPRLAELTTRWIAVANTLTVERKNRQVARGDLTSAVGRAVLEEFFAAFLKEKGLSPRIIDGNAIAFDDQREPLVSIISQASVHDVERVAGRPLDLRRFRANVVIDGLAPWQEAGWVGQDIRIGDVRLQVVEEIARCGDNAPALNVNPDTGQADIALPRLLTGGLGRETFGIRARVVAGGVITVGSIVDKPQAS